MIWSKEKMMRCEERTAHAEAKAAPIRTSHSTLKIMGQTPLVVSEESGKVKSPDQMS
jgi:hypothetical protein